MIKMISTALSAIAMLAIFAVILATAPATALSYASISERHGGVDKALPSERIPIVAIELEVRCTTDVFNGVRYCIDDLSKYLCDTAAPAECIVIRPPIRDG